MNGVVIKILVYVDPMDDVHITAKVDDTIYRLKASRRRAGEVERPLDL